MKIHLIRNEEQIVNSWTGGETKTICIFPSSSSYENRNFAFRVSRATVLKEESNFTILNGIQRIITILKGSIQLSHNNSPWFKLNNFEPYEFSGDLNTKSRGICEDFNLMTNIGFIGAMDIINLKDNYLGIISLKEKYSGFYPIDGDIIIHLNDNFIEVKKEDFLFIENNNEFYNFEIKNNSHRDCKVIRIKVGCE